MPGNRKLVAAIEVKVDGSPLDPDASGDVLECVVENSLHLPDACTLRLFNGDGAYMECGSFAEGSRLQIAAGWKRNSLTSIFDGEIVGLELDLESARGSTFTIRAYGRGHRLHRGRKTKSYVQVKDSDIVSQVASAAGFTTAIDQTRDVRDWVFQDNQTDWEFLTSLARRNGFRLYVKDQKTLCFKKVANSSSTPITLQWGTDLRSFRVHTSAVQQVDKVTVKGWDPDQKQAVLGTCATASGVPQVGGGMVGSSVASDAFGSAEMIVVSQPVKTQTEAEDMARSICDDIGGSYLEAEGVCRGDPSLKPGAGVKVDKVGETFSGTYTVTATHHVYSAGEGYTTRFFITGKRPESIFGLLDDERPSTQGGLGGCIVVAVVTDNNDPDKKGRVKVKYPWLTEEHTSFWARQASPMAGKNRGLYFLPEIDDEVLVAFEHGDISRPYIIGGLWNGVDTVIEGNDVAVVNKKVVHRIIKTRAGHTLTFDDTDETGEVRVKTNAGHAVFLSDKDENITLQSKAGHVVCLNDKDQKVTVVSKGGHKVSLDDQGRKVEVADSSGNQKLTLDGSGNSVKIECMGDFTVDAKGQVSIKGIGGVTLDTPANLKASGTGGVAIESTAQVSVKGTAMTSVESSGILKIQGSLVKIN